MWNMIGIIITAAAAAADAAHEASEASKVVNDAVHSYEEMKYEEELRYTNRMVGEGYCIDNTQL